jgi:hypothetical protein
MSREINESDWKVFRELRQIALDRFCQRILDEIRQVSADPNRGAHERYLAVYDLIRRCDREIADAFNDPRRSTAFPQLLAIQSHKLLTEEELGRFSPDVREFLRSCFK